MNYIEELGQKAQNAKKSLATASTGQKTEILRCIADRHFTEAGADSCRE